MTETDALSQKLSRRERQIMDILYRHGRATAAEVQADLPDPPSYSAVRAHAARARGEGPRAPRAGRAALRLPADAWRATAPSSPRCAHLVRTFFDGSREQVVAALLDDSTTQLSDDELDRLSRLIDRARQEGA